MQNLENHPTIETIKNWIEREKIDMCTVNEVWQKALGRTTDVIKDENWHTLRDLHKVCVYAGLVKTTTRLDGKTFRVLVPSHKKKSAL